VEEAMAKKVPKRRITTILEDVSPYDLECSLSDLGNKIQDWINKYGPDARLDWDAYFQYGHDSNPSPRFNIKIDREETEDEYDERLQKESVQQSAREAQERAEFERLRTKFEGKK
jgi:hypothetical protein